MQTPPKGSPRGPPSSPAVTNFGVRTLFLDSENEFSRAGAGGSTPWATGDLSARRGEIRSRTKSHPTKSEKSETERPSSISDGRRGAPGPTRPSLVFVGLSVRERENSVRGRQVRRSSRRARAGAR